ncbi:TonB-dependent siderophore receptor [Dyadobacter sp. CY356]|uniref:TonB-dependent receptor plug domain-containing protein n=1 Tax=Dyadobacter sp. CY356 TaxID=2906442 RepID=UPI001F237009|nr:TonB-dependent receptor [Dyadobacter sp. CY356]MCF0056579.1 TonB-dependent receptor [Dyadobacter sp. CY356]
MAQKDSIHLNPVTVYGYAPERFMSGLKVQKIDSAALEQFRFRNITDLLSLNTPIIIKNYGPGQLATVAFRGTSANHTAVLWNGLNINLPTLGQTDFSTIPVAGFDQLSVQYGSSASIVGTDAVGGSILLGSTMPQAGLQIMIGRQQESFRNSQMQATIKYGTSLSNKWIIAGKTAAYDSRMNNHYPYTERNKKIMIPSETFQKGIVQDLYFTKNKHQLSAHFWLTDNQLTNNPEIFTGREFTGIKSYRSMLRYQVENWTVRTSWIRDILNHASGDYSKLDHAVTDRIGARIERAFEWKFTNLGNIQIQAGGEFTHYITHFTDYEKPVTTENREDLFLLTRWQATSKFLVSVNLRQAFVTGFNPPFTPSLGAEYQLIQTNVKSLKIRSSIGRSYRVPTLNERYWKSLGNPDIRPEDGFNKEVGLEGKHISNNINAFTASVTAYHNRINNWIYWNPSRNFHVENLQLVVARGIETQIGWKGNWTIWKAGSNLNYAFTKSTQEKVYDAYASDKVGKQLSHIPLHSGNINLFVQYKQIRFTNQLQCVSKRYTLDDHAQFSQGYILENFLAETTFNWHGTAASLQGRVNNINNSFYQSINGNPMPGRSFALSLLISLKTDNHTL